MTKLPAPHPLWKVGDRLSWGDASGDEREITKVRPTGYSWRYLHTPEREFYSENSNTPAMGPENGWRKV